MLITRECDYAVRCIRALASFEKRSVKEICDAEHIPMPYAYKILKKLEKGGLVEGSRGATGGYTLAKPLNSFTLLTIVLAVEKDLLLNECLCDDFDCPNNQTSGGCKANTEFVRIQKILTDALAEKTIDEVFK